MTRLASVLAACLLAALSLGVLAEGWRGDAGYIAAGLLVFIAPGVLFLLALPRDLCPPDGLERFVTAMGVSLALSMSALWIASVQPGPGMFERWLVVLALALAVLVLLAVWRSRAPLPHAPAATGTQPASPVRVALVAGVLVAAALLRFGALGYGEYYDDELDVVQSARSLLLGQSSVILEHRKGPTEIWLTALAAASSGRLDEATTRLPFALASLGAVLLTLMIGERWLGRGRGIIAGLLLGAEGVFLAFSRLVQYQGVVLLLVALVVWFALRFWHARSLREQTYHLLMGALCWSFATLTHWDGVLSAVPLAVAVAGRWLPTAHWPELARQLRAAPLLRLAAIALAAALPPSIFYAQLFLHPKSEQARQYYDERLGYGLFNGAPDFLRHATFYNASPFIAVVLVLAGLALASRLSRRGALLVMLAALPFVWAEFLQAGPLNFSGLLTFGLLVLLLRSAAEMPFKLAALWALSYFIVFVALIRYAGLHFYALMPAVCLLAADALLRGAGIAPRRALQPADSQTAPPLGARRRFITYAEVSARLFGGHSARRSERTRGVLAAVALAALLALAWRFDLIAYTSADEYALNYPRTALWWSPSLYTARPTDYFFGFPYRYGWSTVGWLYRRGVLRGKFDTNETYLVTDWYARDLEGARADEPRYYLRVDQAPRGGALPADLDERFHPWGEVRVRGATKIRIYESNRFPASAPAIHDDENYPSADPELLARSRAYRSARGDDRAFRELGKYLDRTAGAADVIVLDTPLLDGILPYYYSGAARLVRWDAPDAPAVAAAGASVYAALFAATGAERTLAERLYPLEARWFGSVRLAVYVPPAGAVQELASGAEFGGTARLTSYSLGPANLRGGDFLRLALTWQALAPAPARLKVFVHVLDAQGKVVAQRDAEPVADLAPATDWKAGQMLTDHHAIRLPANLPPQSLRVTVGLYDAQSGARLPAMQDGQRAANDAVALGEVSVR